MSSTSRHLVVIPTYEESENIEAVLAGVRAACDADVLVVDDGSPDGTADLALAAGRRLGGVFVLRRAGKRGLGAAYRAGFAWALERDYDVVVEMDGDMSHDPATVPELIAATRHAALVLGSRYVPGGDAPDWSWHRKQLSRWANRYAATMLGLPVKDSTGGFRAYRTGLLTKLELSTVQADGYAFQIELVDRSWRAGARIQEIPITFRDRARGRSKMSASVIFEAMRLVTKWGLARRLRSYRLVADERAGRLRRAERLRRRDSTVPPDRTVGAKQGDAV